MKELNETPNIKKLFKDDNLSVQPVYKTREEYDVLYINEKLYEEIFKEKYEWNRAVEKIKNKFSITLDKENSNNVIVGNAFSDKQFDPTGMALSGNLGSGRAYFYEENFNIKGDKTNLATSPKSIYSNGKYALSAAIKETIIANILAKDFSIKTFETLAILNTKKRFDFIDEYLDSNDVIKQEIYNLPCSIEIRVNKNKELYRISNSLINKDKWNKNDIFDFAEKLAKIEANKFCDRFLHGSWSVGNISTDGNLIDFDTATFVKGRYPQYSNTNKYKSNYFGYELYGQKMMIKSIIENSNIEEANKIQRDVELFMDEKYQENMKIKFCDLIGLDYNLHYQKHCKYINNLYEKFDILSRKFLPNYYETNVVEDNGDLTYLFDFSRFFQKYLLCKRENKNNMLIGMKLLINNTEYIEYESIGMIKEKVDEFFKHNLVNENDIDKNINKAMDFIEEYDELFCEISKEMDLSSIILKQYIINTNRNYLYGNDNIYGELSYLYDEKLINNNAVNKLINALIQTNMRNNYSDGKEIKLGLKIYKEFMTYWVLSKKSYYLIIEPFSNIDIEFAKAFINGEEIMMRHFANDKERIMVSEVIEFATLQDILEFDVKLTINGKEYKEKLLK